MAGEESSEGEEPERPSGGNGNGNGGGTSGSNGSYGGGQPGGGDSGTGGEISQSEDVIAAVGKLNINKDPKARPGGYGRGGKVYKTASDQPGGKLATGIRFGCTNEKASNYNPFATLDDGSCLNEPMTKTDPRVISKTKKFLQTPKSTLKLPDLGLFNIFFGFDKLNPTVQTPKGVIIDNNEEAGTATATGAGSFRAGVERVKDEVWDTDLDDASDIEEDKMKDLITVLKGHIKASYMIASQKGCGDCDKKFIDDYLSASTLLLSLMISMMPRETSGPFGGTRKSSGELFSSYATIDTANVLSKINSMTTDLINRNCKEC